jgi:antitoxin Phd
MTRKPRATRHSVPARAKTTDATRVHLAKHGEHSATWKLEEAKAKFSEVVRRAHDQGPQYVTVRGKQAVAIIDAAELERLLPANPAVVPLVQFLESLYVEGLDLTRDRDLGRDPAL